MLGTVSLKTNPGLKNCLAKGEKNEEERQRKNVFDKRTAFNLQEKGAY